MILNLEAQYDLQKKQQKIGVRFQLNIKLARQRELQGRRKKYQNCKMRNGAGLRKSYRKDNLLGFESI